MQVASNRSQTIRKRGVGGWLSLILFVAFNIFMAWAMLSGIFNVSQLPIRDEVKEADAAIFGIVGVGTVLSIWLAGATVLGFLTFLTRGAESSDSEKLD